MKYFRIILLMIFILISFSENKAFAVDTPKSRTVAVKASKTKTVAKKATVSKSKSKTTATKKIKKSKAKLVSNKAAEVKPAKFIVPLPVRRPQIAEAEVSSPFTLKAEDYGKIGEDYRLSPKDAGLSERIFALQEIGNLEKANKKIAELENHILMGHILYQRYMGEHYKPSYEELVTWLKNYSDHAGAQDMYDLALRKKTSSSKGSLSKVNEVRAEIGFHFGDIGRTESIYIDEKEYKGQKQEIINKIKERIKKDPEEALESLEKGDSRRMLDEGAYDTLRGRIAESFFYSGRPDKAYALATVSADRSGKDVPLAAWIAGLSCWKYKDYNKAAKYFEITATSKRSSAWMSSAGAYWAARSYLRAREPQEVSKWLKKAAENPRSFYGIIAVKTLGMEHTRFNWNVADLSEKMMKALAGMKAGRRALALMDSKNYEMAERELRQVDPRISRTVQQAMMAVAHQIGAPDFEIKLGSGLKDKAGKLYDSALYPDARWLPDGEYYIDRALIHAFIRQESRFSYNAKSPSGAVGLMQLMPATADIVAKKMGLRDSRKKYNEPKVNILIGQKYIDMLLNEKAVRNNLFKLAVAYNAGPGKLANWESVIEYDDDPLLFIESIPASETRTFVEKILANYWIYRLKYNKKIDSLEQVASGDWPFYNKLDVKE